MPGGMSSVANYITLHQQTQPNRVCYMFTFFNSFFGFSNLFFAFRRLIFLRIPVFLSLKHKIDHLAINGALTDKKKMIVKHKRLVNNK